MTSPQALIEVARSYVGVPFRHQGRDRQGIDCVGLVVATLRELNALPDRFEDVTDYPRYSQTDNLSKLIRRYCYPINEAIPGTIIAIAWKKHVAHVALCSGDTLIQSFSKPGLCKVIEHGYRGKWRSLTSGIWAIPGVAYG